MEDTPNKGLQKIEESWKFIETFGWAAYHEHIRLCALSIQAYKNQGTKKLSLSNVSESLPSEAMKLLKDAADLVGNPGTNISGSTDRVCLEWHDRYERWRKANVR